MSDFQSDFIDFLVEQGAMLFGEFTLKSGRTSPYFFNASRFQDGTALSRLGEFYAKALVESGLEYDLLFGPAYKGIPLVVATAIAMDREFGRSVPYAFNRKEAKDHGEGGQLVGAPLAGRVVVVDDVVSAGTAVGEAVSIIDASDAELSGIVVALDRQEKGKGDRSAIQELERTFGVKVASIVKFEDVLQYVTSGQFDPALATAIRQYRDEFGVRM